MNYRTLKKFIAVIVCFFLVNSFFAQSNTLKEVFPLNVGNKWTYGFNTGFSSGMSHSAANDSGIVELEITGMIDSPDSIRWQFFQRREYYHDVYGIPASGWKKDSSNFELIELNEGFHELYVSPFNKDAVFPYINSSNDSEKIFRYADSSASNDFVKTRGIIKQETDHYEFTFKVDTGMVKSIRGWSNASASHNWARYYLFEFHNSYNEAFLSIPHKSVSIITLSGIPKDTAITILNDGSQSLIISNIISSNDIYTVVDFNSTVPPHSAGKITVRFHPLIVGNSSTVLTIYSNSLPSPNTITVKGIAYDAIILHLQPNDAIQFGGIPNGKMMSKTYSISNLGNIELKIDSIRITHPVFTNKLRSSNITPGQTTIDTVYFFPLITAEYSAELKLYSNSRPAPYIIWLYGISAEEINVELNPQSINFGKVAGGEIKDTAIVITNHGKESIFLLTYINNDLVTTSASPFIFPGIGYSHSTEIKPYSTYTETIRFMPKNSNYISSVVLNEFSSLNNAQRKGFSAKLEGNFYDLLNQNYPNPFNITTKIKFQISSKSMARLKIFDILGREVYTLIDEQLEQGTYEKIFNGSGLASGVYFYMLQTGSFSETKKFVLMK